jgi:hypothetical protein
MLPAGKSAFLLDVLANLRYVRPEVRRQVRSQEVESLLQLLLDSGRIEVVDGVLQPRDRIEQPDSLVLGDALFKVLCGRSGVQPLLSILFKVHIDM